MYLNGERSSATPSAFFLVNSPEPEKTLESVREALEPRAQDETQRPSLFTRSEIASIGCAGQPGDHWNIETSNEEALGYRPVLFQDRKSASLSARHGSVTGSTVSRHWPSAS